MRRYLILLFLLLVSVSSSGCVLGMAALIRWDRKRWKAHQEKERVLEERWEKDSEPTGSGAEIERRDSLQPMPESVPGTEKEDSVPVPTDVE